MIWIIICSVMNIFFDDSARQCDFFPIEDFSFVSENRNITDSITPNFIFQYLREFDEKSIYCYEEQKIRLLIIKHNEPPICVVIQKQDEDFILYRKIAKSQEIISKNISQKKNPWGYDLKVSFEFAISKYEIDSSKADFIKMKLPKLKSLKTQTEGAYMDGITWILEFRDSNDYRVILRSNLDQETLIEFREICFFIRNLHLEEGSKLLQE